MANKTPEQIVALVEEELAASRPCPFCDMYSTHQPHCLYLFHKGNVDAKKKGTTPAIMETPEVSPDTTDESKETATKDILEKMKPK